MKSNVFFVNNVIFDSDISTNSKLVYLYLCKCANSDGQCFPSHNTIAAACGISVTTTKKALNELENAKLLETQRQKRENKGTRTNLYTVYNDRTGGYFKAPYFVFSTELSSKAKLVFFYFCRLAGNNDSVYPAHKTTAKACGLSVAGARAAIDELEADGLITREAQFRADNGQRANIYTLIYPCYDAPGAPTDGAHDEQNDATEAERDGQTPIEDTEQSCTETENSAVLENTGVSQPLSTNSSPLSQLIATAPAISWPSELKNIMIKINNDIKSLIIRKKESKKILRYMPVYGVSCRGQVSEVTHKAREPTFIFLRIIDFVIG